MKLIVITFLFGTLFVFSGCHSDLVQKNYERSILKNVVSFTIPQFQSSNEIQLIKANKVKAIAFISFSDDKSKADSLTFVEFDPHGKVIRKTTTENTTQGCLPYMIRQEFFYSNNKILRTVDYTFKYKANSILENWLLRDTSKLNLFDYEDYRYNGDTIIVETGFAVNTFIKDTNDNIIKRIVLTKTDKKTHTWEYEFNDNSVIQKLDSPPYNEILITEYLVENNLVKSEYSSDNNDSNIENSFYENGLLKSKTFYNNGVKQYKIMANYFYY